MYEENCFNACFNAVINTDRMYEVDVVVEEDDGMLEYSDLASKTIFTNIEAENKSDDKYVVYYYQEECGHCITLKQDILTFALDFNYLDFYIIDISKTPDFPNYQEFRGTPTVYVISDHSIVESYVGSEEILGFIDVYTNIQFEYDLFINQTLTSYNEIIGIESDRYLVYYYLETSLDCEDIKYEFLSWAFTKNIKEIYLVDGAILQEDNTISNELPILSLGSPLLIVMSDGNFTGEYYLGIEDILDYIELD